MAKRTKSDDPEGTTGMANDSSSESQSGILASGMVDSAKQAASQAKEAAGQVFDQAKDQATSRVDQQRETLASGIQAVAQAFRSMGEDLRTSKEQGPVAQYAAEMGEAVGGQVERLAKYLREKDVRHLVTDVEDFARRSPAIFLGSAFVLGLAASRFLKSSRPAPDFIANMPDPNRALPPATTPASGLGPTQTKSEPATSAPFWATPSGAPSAPTGSDPTGGL